MKITFTSLVVFITVITISAKKHNRASVIWYNDSSGQWRKYNKNLDFRGSLRKSFFVHSALSTPNDNTICSPISVLMPLAKLALGAEGATLEELLTAIGVTKRSLIGNDFKPIIAFLKYVPGVKLDIASKIYISVKTHLQKTFSDQAREIFESSAEKLDFLYPIFAAQEINSWGGRGSAPFTETAYRVSLQTNSVIKSIITAADILPTTSMIIINAVYFSGKWNNAFEKIQSVKFHGPNSFKILTMMTRTGFYNYTKSEALGAELIKIPYKWERAIFMIVLPTSRTGLPLLLSQLKIAPEVLDAAMTNMRPTMTQIIMPKFKIETELNLNEMYQKMGVQKIFDARQSELVKIVRDETLFVSKSKHKAYIDVNEYGTEAGAATGTMTSKLAQPVAFFKADHPFLYFIFVNGQQLFSGTYVNPQ